MDGKNISRPIIKNINPDNVAVGVFALTSEISGKISQNELRKKAVELSHILQEINGVANIEISGGERKSLNITVDAEKLKNRNLTIVDIKNAVQGNNGRALLGNIKDGTHQHQIEIDAGVMNDEQAKKIILGNGITLGEVATVEDGYLEKVSNTSFYSENSGKISDAVFISLAKRKGVNTDFVMTQAQEKFQKFLDSEFGGEISGTLVRNNAKIANDSISGLGVNLIQSILIVSIVLYLFLGARSAFLVAIAIPTTLLFVFFVGYISGQSINKITLFALILSLGLLVDSATVVVENINRHLQEFNNDNNNDNDGRDKSTPLQKNNTIKDIIIVSVNEVGIGLFLSTLTSVIVFLPMAHLSGMMGAYMGPLAFFVPLSLILALIIAYVITPFLSYLVFKNKIDHAREDCGRNKSTPLLSSFLQIIQKKYAILIRKILENSKTQKIILFGAFGTLFLTFSFIFLELVHFQMLPKSDNESFWVTLDFPEGTDEPVTQNLAEKITAEISKKTPDIEHIQIFSGTAPVVDFNGLFREFSQRGGSHQASLLVSLSDDRKFSSEKNATHVRKVIKNFQKISVGNANLRSLQTKDFIFRVVENPPGPPVQATFVAKIKGQNSEAQKLVLQKLQKIVEKTSGIVDIDSSQEEKYPKTVFKIDSEKAKQKGLINKDIYDALSLSFAPQKIGEFHPENSQELAFVELKTENSARDEISDFSEIFLRNTRGEMIPLSSVLKTEEKKSRPSLFRDTHISTQYITAEMENRSIIYAVRDIIFAIFNSENSGLTVESFSLYSIDV
ncbi:TPA: efflux RND transporter permease subunit, partial [Candidatus Peregrinibacteria bacterium]|nr:efflux RND transporter permease subunit [Candidatus Peregrinibacteria bacterium]